MRVRLLSRGSDLARLQTRLVEQALRTSDPQLDIEKIVRSSLGDRDSRIELWQSTEKGLFTSDLSGALLADDADVAVHSWKDLPVEGFAGTVVAATLERADPRDVLLVRADVLAARPAVLDVLTSSPRRTFQLAESLPGLLPWPITGIEPKSVRGNIPTRLQRLAEGQGHALVVAKAALDRLLSPASEPATRDTIRHLLAGFHWTVLPLREFPTAPAQGALALEVATARQDIRAAVARISHEATHRAVDAERQILAGYGGGCHEAIGATVLVREYGVVTSVRGRAASGERFTRWTLDPAGPLPPPAESAAAIWPRPGERDGAVRRPLDVRLPSDDRGWWVARAEAVPNGVQPDPSRLVWAAGTRTWRRLAARGVWVHGCSDGLGDGEAPALDTLAGRTVAWHRLTHARSGAADAFATYTVESPLPDDLPSRTHFFWTSGTLFLDALARHPEIRGAWHGFGPGHTSRVVRDTITDGSRLSVWLDYEQWHQHMSR
ncbi:MAG: hydroxymethylbilane synthase [Acidobacteria bacterium SCN 69-37]|nr:MAG: hydroxymethylbilane synthase [Acidobacteria bacterium SCN 69-37]